ncbi:MAG: M56 family metallopeptidase [Salinivirgaceae bacterium]|nr:M56 family metallopeptidase [Salinivirgaceae bacterium]
MDAIVYSLKVSVFLIAFYLMFKSLMSRETLHRANRYLILGSIGLSFALPLWHITLNAAPGHAVTAAELSQSVVWLEEVIVGGGTSHSFDWRALAVVAFYAGIGVCLLRMIVSIIGVLRVIRRGERQTLPDGTVLVITDDEQAPFSWIKYIIINRKDHDENLQEILTHERAHIRCRHSIDVLVCDVFCCLQWFNPAMWLLRRELCAVHEYEADKAVLDSGINAKQYQILLIKKAAGGKWYSIANSFNHSKLKYRITMMSRKKSSGWTMAKALYVLPIAAFAAIAFANCSKTESENTQDFTYDKTVLQYLPKEGDVKFIGKNLDGTECVLVRKADGSVRRYMEKEIGENEHHIAIEVIEEDANYDVDLENTVFFIVEEMPEFPGGEEGLLKFVTENTKYPEVAKEKKIQGKVFVQFVINRDGNVEDVKLAKGVDPLLDEAAMNIVKSMPQWKPGKQRGQYVKVSFTIPINFQL